MARVVSNMKRFRYRKVTPHDVEIMKEMREAKISYAKIAKVFDVSISVVQYHLKPDYREKVIARTKASPYYKRKGKKRKYLNPKYMTEYIRERYRNDEEFRERYKAMIRKHTKERTKRARERAKNNPQITEKIRAYWRGEIPYSEIAQYYRK